MDNITKINKLKELYLQLLTLVNTYSTSNMSIEKNFIEDIISYIKSVDSVQNEDTKTIFQNIKMMDEHLYPLRGGLADFIISMNDSKKEDELNIMLFHIEDEIWNILKDY
jgi:hypothetical protein